MILLTSNFSLLTSSCGGNNGQFKLEGHFKNMNQGELYIYNMESGHKDTIQVSDGRFSYVTGLEEDATLILLFPNYSELPILAKPGTKAEIEGDVSHLKETEISGTKENKELTAFRMKTNSMLPQQAQNEARKFIKEHPASPSCHYLLRRYFLLVANPDYQEAASLCATILKEQPKNRALLRLRNQLDEMKNVQALKLPNQFSAITTKGDTVTQKHLNGIANVVHIWANWNHDSVNTMALLKRLQKEHPDSIAVMTISMDATPGEGNYVLNRDSITWPNVCDGEMWLSPLVPLFGITSIPATLVADKNGNIMGRNLKDADLEKKINELLKP